MSPPQMTNFWINLAYPVVNSDESVQNREFSRPLYGARKKELLQAINQLGDANEVLNERVMLCMERIRNNVTGRDFSSRSLASGASSMQHTAVHSSLVSGDTR